MNDGVKDCVWQSLETEHLHLGRFAGDKARRYELDTAPFAALAKPNSDCLESLATLMESGEFVYLFEPDLEPSPKFKSDLKGRGLQMVATRSLEKPAPDFKYVELSEKDVPEMLELIAVAFPGYFRERTIRMGHYFGVRVDSKLAAMAGERMAPQGYREVSSVCTHPEYTGRGYGENLMRLVCQGIQNEGRRPILHVGAKNARAIGIYERLGFVVARDVYLWGLTRV